MTGDGRGSGRAAALSLLLYVVLLVVVFLPAFVLTALRLLQPDAGRGVAVVALTPLGLPVYALLALLGLLGLVGRRRAARAVPAVMALLIGLAGAGVHAWWLAPAYRGDRVPAAAGAEPFAVLSLNLEKGTADAGDVVSAARDDDVDILVLVEVSARALATLDAAGLADLFPYRDGRPAPDAGGTMILSRYPVSGAERLVDGNANWSATVALPQGDQVVWAVHPFRPALSGNRWSEGLSALAAGLRTRTPPDLVAGDFNATADHRRFRDLLDEGLRDSAEMLNAGWRPTWPANGDLFGLPRFAQIDHILVGPSLTATATHRVDVAGTDHSGVWAELAAR